MSKASSVAPAVISPRIRQCRREIGNRSRRAPAFTDCFASNLSSHVPSRVTPFGLLFVLVAYAVSALRYQRSAHEVHHLFAVLFEGARFYGHQALRRPGF